MYVHGLVADLDYAVRLSTGRQCMQGGGYGWNSRARRNAFCGRSRQLTTAVELFKPQTVNTTVLTVYGCLRT